MGRFLIGIIFLIGISFNCKILFNGTLFGMEMQKIGEKNPILFDIKDNKYKEDYKDNKNKKDKDGNNKYDDKNKDKDKFEDYIR